MKDGCSTFYVNEVESFFIFIFGQIVEIHHFVCRYFAFFQSSECLLIGTETQFHGNMKFKRVQRFETAFTFVSITQHQRNEW